jgi:hypothetical protein
VKHLIFYLSSCFTERTAPTNIWVKSHRNTDSIVVFGQIQFSQ